MKKTGVRITGVLVAAVAVFAVWARLFAGGPVAFIPGGWIRGEVIAEPIEDWSFAGGAQYLLVESRARTFPYSKRVWFMVNEGDIYLLLPALFGDGLQQRLEEDPRLRIGIDGKVYLQRAVPLENDALVGELMAPVLRRIMSAELEGKVRRTPAGSKLEGASMAIFALTNR
jgi:hypothetical protein